MNRARPHRFVHSPLIFILVILVPACARGPARAPYPHESILTVVAELKIHLNKDPWRQPPGRDLTGANIYRVSLARLESLESMTGEEYADVLAFAAAECLERLGAWARARDGFERAAARQSSLADEARRRAALAGRMATLTDRATFARTLEGYLNDLDVLDRRLADWADEQSGWPYGSFIRLERERAVAEAARYHFNNRMVLAGGLERALDAARRLVDRSEGGWRYCQHLLMLGEFYETLARDWTAEHPPEGADLRLDAPWAGYVNQAREAYQRVAQTDGDPAKPEGQGRLGALEAYALRIEALAR
jgi:hypothetical protein